MMVKKIPLVVAILLIIFGSEISFAGNIKGKVISSRKKYRKNAVVYIDNIAGAKFAPPEEHAAMDQKDLRFIPHILPIVTGTTVDFLNSDAVLHNVFSPDHVADKFNLGTYPQGEVRSHTFSKSCEEACDAVMLCNVHPEMEAYIVVLQNPYFALTDEEGNYIIENVPPGEYVIKVWHEKYKKTEPAEAKVTVSEKDVTDINFELKK